MAPEKAPAFQFYPKDFLTDSHVAAMTLPELGAYIRLLCLCWLDRSLPAELPALARLCKVSGARFSRLWPALKPCFAVTDGRLVQPRMERERVKQETYRAMKAAAGQKGGTAKAEGKQKPGKRLANASPPSSSSLSDLQSSSTEGVRASFTKFWAVYPKPVGEKDAFYEWLAINPEKSQADQIISAAGDYSEHVRDWKPRFIKSPANWLREQRWTDQWPTAPAQKDYAWTCPHDPPCLARHACSVKCALEAAKVSA